LDVEEGDRLLLCTDGLTSMVDRARIQEILQSEPDPQGACDRLIDAANRAGGDDNTTVIVVDFVAEDGADPEPAPASRSSTVSTPDGHAVGGEGAAAPQPPPEPAARGRVRWPRVAIWVGLALVLLGGALIGARLYIDRQWYVGDADGRVAIYKGIPASVAGLDLSHVVEATELATAEVERFQVWRDLHDGITAKSFQDAQSIVTSMRRQVQQSRPASGGG
jgi:protein phosphatase